LYDVTEAPQRYRYPPLQWLRGLDLEFSLDETTLTVHIEVELNER
jgi:hypothetical protein